jgi:hypothetical protein
MICIKKPALAICLFTISLLVNTMAVGQSPISGTWALQNMEHVTGPEFANALPKQITLHQQADSLIIETIAVGADGDVSTRLSVPMNGSPYTAISTASNRKYVRSLKWTNDKKGLTLTTVFYTTEDPTKVDCTRTEAWSFSPDGKQLNIEKKSDETRSESWQAKAIYDKK